MAYIKKKKKKQFQIPCSLPWPEPRNVRSGIGIFWTKRTANFTLELCVPNKKTDPLTLEQPRVSVWHPQCHFWGRNLDNLDSLIIRRNLDNLDSLIIKHKLFPIYFPYKWPEKNLLFYFYKKKAKHDSMIKICMYIHALYICYVWFNYIYIYILYHNQDSKYFEKILSFCRSVARITDL